MDVDSLSEYAIFSDLDVRLWSHLHQVGFTSIPPLKYIKLMLLLVHGLWSFKLYFVGLVATIVILRACCQ